MHPWVGSMLQIQGNEVSFSSFVQVGFCIFKFCTNKVLYTQVLYKQGIAQKRYCTNEFCTNLLTKFHFLYTPPRRKKLQPPCFPVPWLIFAALYDSLVINYK